MNKEELIDIIEKYTMDSSQVLEYLDISKQRLSDMKRTGKVNEVKKGIFLREEVEVIKMNQQDLRKKYNEKSAYNMFPVYKDIGDALIIDKLRFFDCVNMVKHKSTNKVYNSALEATLTSILSKLNKGAKVYLLDHKGFDYIETNEEIKLEGTIIKEFSKESFLAFLEFDGANIIGLDMIGNYYQILGELKEEQVK